MLASVISENVTFFLKKKTSFQVADKQNKS